MENITLDTIKDALVATLNGMGDVQTARSITKDDIDWNLFFNGFITIIENQTYLEDGLSCDEYSPEEFDEDHNEVYNDSYYSWGGLINKSLFLK